MVNRQLYRFLYLIFVIFFSFFFTSYFCKSDRIKLKDIEVLTFKQDYVTTSRRTSPIPQLKCIGGSAKCAFRPDVIKCYNKGTTKDGNINWLCQAEINKNLHLDKIDINCEGYNHPKDEFILADSCGLEYTMEAHKEDDDQDSDFWFWAPTNLLWAWLWRVLRIKSFQSFLRNIVIFLVVSTIVYLIFFAISGRFRRRSRPTPHSSPWRSSDSQTQGQPQESDNTDALGGLWREFLTPETLRTLTRGDSSDEDDIGSPLLNIGAKIFNRQVSNRIRRR